jgi:hypothetical protein
MTLGDPFRNSDLREPLVVSIRKLRDDGRDWEEMAADMLAPITGLTDAADTAAMAPSVATTRSNRCGKPIAALGQRLSTSSPTATELREQRNE